MPWKTKLSYASAEMGLVAVEAMVEIYLLKFYNVVVGLDPIYTGLALAIAILWDAVTDPVMGWVSDGTRTVFGRRRPYILPGGIALAACFILIYNPPHLDSVAFKFSFLLVSYLLLNTAMTVIGVPHISLAAELSFDRNERTEIFGARRLFSTLGLLLGTLLPAFILRLLGGLEDAESVARSRSLASVALAAPIVLTAWISVRATRGLDPGEKGGRLSRPRSRGRLGSLFREQGSVLTNRVFRPLLLAFVIVSVGRALNASTALYYYEYRLGLTEQQAILVVLLPFFLCLLASIPIWLSISRRLGKKRPAFWGLLLLALLTGISYVLLPTGRLLGPFLVAVVSGLLGGVIILFESLVADTVDYDELLTGKNREGLYFGVWKMSTKLSRALGLLLAGLLLSRIGFDEQAQVQGREVSVGLAIVFGPGVASLLLAGALVFGRVPLTDRLHRRIQRLLQDRRDRRLDDLEAPARRDDAD